MTTIRLRGRNYSVEAVERTTAKGTVEVSYVLTGKRGGKFISMRNHHRPERMFIVSMALSNRTLDGVWLSDGDGTLSVLSQ